MRTLILAGITMVTAIAAVPADAQRLGGMRQQPGGGVPVVLPPPPMIHQPGTAYPAPMPHPPMMQPSNHYPPNMQHPPRGYDPRLSRWGGTSGGHWHGGTNAPGGWNAYRRPSRGYTLPRYWIAPSFYIGNYGAYGLSPPPYGYNWTRYYDDAVLTDRRGRVYDSVGGIDWDGYDDGGYGYTENGYGDGDGYDVSGQGYAEGGAGNAGAPYPAPPRGRPLPPVTQGGYTTTYSSGGYATGGYASGGYYYPPATTTTVTIQSAPVVTTTTTEYIETMRYVGARKVYRAPKRKWHPPVRRRTCRCEQPIRGS